MRKSTFILPATVIGFSLMACSHVPVIEVSNPLDEQRSGEIVEVPVSALSVKPGQAFVLRDAAGAEVPYQITYDSLLIFPATVPALATSSYYIEEGTPAPADTVVTGRVYPDRSDDLVWENQWSGYRAYGPAYQANGGMVFGYDVHTKSVDYPAVDERYTRERTKANWDRLQELRDAGRTEEADSLFRWISYHIDSGTGMDPYTVGPTLGAGASAFMLPDSTLVYPRSYQACEILDNGPLRFTVDMTFGPVAVGNDTVVTEHRLLTLDSGSLLNRTVIRYDGLSATQPLATGIVVHRQNPMGYLSDSDLNLIAYADSTDNPRVGNGVIYLGAFIPSSDKAAPSIAFLPMPEMKADAVGHTVLISDYAPGNDYVYYWGSGWSKHDIPTPGDWMTMMRSFARRVNSPLSVTIK